MPGAERACSEDGKETMLLIEQTHPSSSDSRKDLLPDLGGFFSPGILGF